MSETPYRVTERRPIAAREWRFSKLVAHWLAQAGASPNGISVAGMVSGIVAGLALASTAYAPTWAHVGWLLGAVFIQLRLLANMLDGMVAIERKVASPVGELFNEVPDRISDAAVLIGAGYAAGSNIALGYIAACLAVFVAYVRAVGKASGAPNDFCGPMAKQHRMALLTAVSVFCAIAPRSWQPLWVVVAPTGLLGVVLVVIAIGCVATSVRRLSRIAAHLKAPKP